MSKGIGALIAETSVSFAHPVYPPPSDRVTACGRPLSPRAGRTPFSTGLVRSHAAAIAALFMLCAMPLPVYAAEGDHGEGHGTWHGEFYSQLMRPDTKTSCCNLADCRPTEIRAARDHYEVKKDGRWIRVPPEKIVKVAAPDGGAHICAPPSTSSAWGPDDVYCIVMPFEI